MSDLINDQLLQKFAEMVVGHEEAVRSGDAHHANVCARAYMAIANDLIKTPSGIMLLASLLNDRRNCVRLATAIYLLPFKTEEAKLILRDAKEVGGVIGLAGIMALAKWERGDRGMWEAVKQVPNQ